MFTCELLLCNVNHVDSCILYVWMKVSPRSSVPCFATAGTSNLTRCVSEYVSVFGVLLAVF
jgi:hypothetical protein